MQHAWTLRPRRHELSSHLARQLNLHPVVAHVLINRGVESADAGRVFLDRRLANLHDPETMPGIAAAADRIHRAAVNQQSICIYGDYDVDGMCATSILLECLRLENAKVRFYVPDRLEEGYGVNIDALRRLKDDGVELVVTVDCGVAGLEEARVARALGLGYIVTDHHEYGPELPDADAVVHPRLPGSMYPFGELCGAGVAFKLAWEIARRFSGARKTTERFQNFLLNATSLAAIGTVCDVVPLVGENRVMVHHGLLSLRRSAPVGLKALMEAAAVRTNNRLTSSDLAFAIGPRLNSCGRLGQARLGIELLTTRDEQRAIEIARYLDGENKVRQTLERRMFIDARKRIEEMLAAGGDENFPAIVLDGTIDDWHPGVIGIVANRLVEHFHRPCILIAFNGESGAGSGRSIPGFHLQETLLLCRDHIEGGGGHAMAVGLRLRRERFTGFRDEFLKRAAERASTAAAAELFLDAEAPLHLVNVKMVHELDHLEPFGMGNPAPLFLATDLELVGSPKKVGGGERHLSFRVRQGYTVKKAIAFGQGDRLDQLTNGGGKCCLAFSPIINEFRGYPEVELRVKDFHPGGQLVGQEHAPCPDR